MPVEALACGAPVIAFGRGGVAETVDDRVGRLYPEASPEALGETIRSWEQNGCPHDAGLGRSRAEGYSIRHFEARQVALIAEVLSSTTQAIGSRRRPIFPGAACRPLPFAPVTETTADPQLIARAREARRMCLKSGARAPVLRLCPSTISRRPPT